VSLPGIEPLQLNEKTSIKYKRRTLIILSLRLLQQSQYGSNKSQWKVGFSLYSSVHVCENGYSVKLDSSTVYFALF
jgi:hypothetical protein